MTALCCGPSAGRPAQRRPGARACWLSLLMGVIAAAAGIGLLTTSGYLISKAALGPPILTLTVAIVGVRAFAVGRSASRYAERLLSHDVALRVLAATRRRVYERLVPLVPGGIPRMRTGDVLSRAIADVDALQHVYVRALGPPVVAVAVCAGATGVAWAILPAGRGRPGRRARRVRRAAPGYGPPSPAAGPASSGGGARRPHGRGARSGAVRPALAAYGLEERRIGRVAGDRSRPRAHVAHGCRRRRYEHRGARSARRAWPPPRSWRWLSRGRRRPS